MTTVIETRSPGAPANKLRRADFDYVLPPERIAQSPLAQRDHSQLMVVQSSNQTLVHQHFYDVGQWLRAGDVLVLNATRVFPARLRGHKRSGGKVDVLLLRPEAEDCWWVLIRGHFNAQTELVFAEGLSGRLEGREQNGEWRVRFSQADIRNYLNRHGEMPLPPYIKRKEGNTNDRERYQTVYAQQDGSIAAPTAGFHFTPDLLESLRTKGVKVVEIVLHVGWGTFRPVRSEWVENHTMLPEYFEVTEAATEQLNSARREGRRIVAVGTTSVRTLESIFEPDRNLFHSGCGQTNLFIYPGYHFRAVDSLVTNFHLPDSTPLFLACAFYSDKSDHPTKPFSLQEAYQAAIQENYRFYSYGDAMMIQ